MHKSAGFLLGFQSRNSYSALARSLGCLLPLLFVLGCASPQVDEEEDPVPTQQQSPAQSLPPASPPVAMPSAQLLTPPLATPPSTTTSATTSFKLPEAPITSLSPAPLGTDPQQALRWLINGNIRFQKNLLRKDGQSRKDIERVAKVQKPHTIVLSCSDSHAPPELVFDQKLGELFVVRTLGESLESNTLASIEYAIEQLGVRLVLVMGHGSCGSTAAKTAANPKYSKSEAWADPQGIASDLMARSLVIKNQVASGGIRVEAALYNLNTGKVDFRSAD